jgi:ribosomal protein L20
MSQKTKKTLITNPNLPNLWVDSIETSFREDGLCLLRFSTNLPEGNVEQCRILVNNKLLKNFIDLNSKKVDKSDKKA